jgi:hypothetical protein
VFNPTGTSFYITGTNNDNVYQYNLGTAWNISTAAYVPNPFHVGAEENTPTGMFIDFAADNRAYVSGSSTDAVYQYNTATTTVSFASDRFNWNGNCNIAGNTYANGDVDISGVLTVYNTTAVSSISISSSLTASSTISLSGNTTSTTALGTAATTGTTTIGGTAQTGAITIGQSTAAQTLNLATGSPASATTQVVNIGTGAGTTTTASTKNINIGTAGITGTNTNIAIGSAVSGAISRTTLNGIVINSISAAVSAAGATQGTATALTTNINNITTTGASADGVILPTAVAGMRILIRNSAATTALKIYPATGGQINALGANAAFSLAAGSTTELMATTTTQWYTF